MRKCEGKWVDRGTLPTLPSELAQSVPNVVLPPFVSPTRGLRCHRGRAAFGGCSPIGQTPLPPPGIGAPRGGRCRASRPSAQDATGRRASQRRAFPVKSSLAGTRPEGRPLGRLPLKTAFRPPPREESR